MESGTTGTVTYTYATSAPASWSHTAPSSWTKVTDALSKDWYYGHNSDGTVMYSVDPLWVNSTHESYTEYAYNADLQVTSVKTPKPNAESGQLTTSYFYNANKNLAAVVDAYGVVTWYKYGTRASYDDSGTGATVNDVIGIFTPYPNQKAYADTDHTSSETVAPSLSSPVDVDSYVSWDSDAALLEILGRQRVAQDDQARALGDGLHLRHGHGQAGAAALLLAGELRREQRHVIYADHGQRVLQAGVRLHGRRPRQDIHAEPVQGLQPQVDGVHLRPDLWRGDGGRERGLAQRLSASKKTMYTYNATKTRVTKVQQPQDNTNQWQVTTYDDRLFATGVQRTDIGSWSVDPIVSCHVYDNNGKLYQSWQADPDYASTPRWDGNTAHGYNKVRELTYDRLGRVIQSDHLRGLGPGRHTVKTLSTYFTYDLNGNLTRVKGPGYVTAAHVLHLQLHRLRRCQPRLSKSYNAVASTNSNLTSAPGRDEVHGVHLRPGGQRQAGARSAV